MATSSVLLSSVAKAERATAYDFQIKDIKGKSVSLEHYKDSKVWLVVNVASQCGYTQKNYAELQTLYERYHDKGLEILAFPCNQFGLQEPKSESEILSFVESKYHVTFPIFSKIDVNGPNADSFFVYLKKTLPGTITDDVKWNFTKFVLVNGVPYKRYGTITSPLSIEADIKELLEKNDKHTEL